ncbi:MAG: ABC transporter permease [Gemmatimonadota bacterium]|nr:MAG: ABC transporter permease [Gemmatimonadota bacterium]
MSRPPFAAEALLRKVLPNDAAGRSVVGDLTEEFGCRVQTNPRRARLWYWREVTAIVAHRIRDHFTGTPPDVRLSAGTGKGDGMLRRIWSDLRFGTRTLRRTPGFTVVAAVTLALGIGANTTIFSVVDSVLFNPLPYHDSDRLVGVYHTAPGLGYDQFGISPGIFLQYEEQNDVFERMAIFTSTQRNLTGEGDPERVIGTYASRGLIEVLAVPPLVGRNFVEEEDLPDGPHAVIVSYGLWTRRFGSDPSLVGRSILLNGEPYSVVGVMPEGFAFPDPETEFWLPAAIDPAASQPGNFAWNSVARLRPGITEDQAQARLGPLVSRLTETYADFPQLVSFLEAAKIGVLVHSVKEEVVGELERPLWILLGTVAFVLLIACANVANLFLVRAEARSRESAVRTALGAGRWVLARQYLSEAVLLAGVGGILGLVLARAGVTALVRAAPGNLPRINEVGIDGSALIFTFGATVVSALLFGMAPALKRVSPALLGSLIQSGARTSAGRERQLMRNALVVAQTALALVLLIGSGLLVRSFWEIRNVNPGFDARDVVTFRLTLPGVEYTEPAAVGGFHQQLLERIAGLPGVESVGATEQLPLSDSKSGTAFEIEDQQLAESELPPIFWYTATAPGYFETMRIPILAGRSFDRSDHETELQTVIVSAPLAQQVWPGEDAVGKRIRFASDSAQWMTVVGVAGATRDHGLREDPIELIYHPIVDQRGTQSVAANSLTYTVRAQNSLALLPAIRSRIAELNATLPIASIELMDRIVARSVARLSFTMLALVVAAVMALLLGAIGLYGVLSYVVSQRTHEIGVRLALGADPSRVRRMVVWQGARMAGAGLVVGVAAAIALTRFLQTLLFATPALDPVAFGTTSALLLVVGLFASYIPARRASAVDPMRSLRLD